MDNVKSNYYYQAFTNAQMTGFDQPFEPASSYTLLSLAYDKYSTPCKVSKLSLPRRPLSWWVIPPWLGRLQMPQPLPYP